MKRLSYITTAKNILYHDIFLYTLLGITGLLCVANLVLFQEKTINTTYQIEDSSTVHKFTFPLVTTTEEAKQLLIQWDLQWARFRAKKYTFIPDDCLESIVINGRQVYSEQIPFCDYDRGRTLDLEEYLVPGLNSFEVVLHNSGGRAGLVFSTANQDFIFLLLHILFFSSISIILWKLLEIRKLGISFFSIRIAIILGILLRVYYYLITNYSVRAHDVDGHIEYIQLLRSHLLFLPSIADGWVLYHPPLYYFLAALWGDVFSIVTKNEQTILRLIQLQSLLYSIFVFCICIWIAKMLFTTYQKNQQLLFITLCATFNGLVFFTARINNDVLVMFLQIGALAFILHWWQTKQMRYWHIALILASLAIITKTSSLILLPILGICLLATRQPRYAIFIHCSIATVVVMSITGWFFYVRFVEEASRHIAGNINFLNSDLALPNTIEIATQFNPIKLVLHPYVEAFNPESGREYFWEYWWKSALFGEFNHGERLRLLASTIILFSMSIIVLGIRGLIITIKQWNPQHFPLLVTGLAFLCVHLVYRFFAPFSPSQDFRYSALSIIPILYCACLGAFSLEGKYKKIAISSLIIFTLLETAFILALGF